MEICKAPTLRLKALNKHTDIMYIKMENVASKKYKKIQIKPVISLTVSVDVKHPVYLLLVQSLHSWCLLAEKLQLRLHDSLPAFLSLSDDKRVAPEVALSRACAAISQLIGRRLELHVRLMTPNSCPLVSPCAREDRAEADNGVRAASLS